MTTPPPPFYSRPPSGGPVDGACARCGADVLDEQFVVRDDVWAAAATAGDRLLCVGCAERSLGRRLGLDDFTDAPLNRWPAMTERERRRSPLLGLPGFAPADADVPRAWSARLLDRLGLGARYARGTDRPDRAAPPPRP